MSQAIKRTLRRSRYLCHLTCRNLCCIADLEPFLTLVPCNLSWIGRRTRTDMGSQVLMMDDCTSLLHKNNSIPAHQPNQSTSRNAVASWLWDSHSPCLALTKSSMNYNYIAKTQQQAYSTQLHILSRPPSFDVILEDAPVKAKSNKPCTHTQMGNQGPHTLPVPVCTYWR